MVHVLQQIVLVAKVLHPWLISVEYMANVDALTDVEEASCAM